MLQRLKEKRRTKAELQNRKSSAAQMRMKSIATLASDAPTSKRRKKGDDDGFGADDSDWMVYHEINTGNHSDEEDHINALKALESKLLENDPTFDITQTIEAVEDPSKSLMHAFRRGIYPKFDSANPEHLHQLHINIERIRVPEVMFQPSIAGHDQAGIVELTQSILNNLTLEDRREVCKDIFVTGGYSLLDGFNSRLETSLRAVVPVEFGVKVHSSTHRSLAAWQGAAQFWRNERSDWQKSRVTRQEYQEYGNDYLKDHRFSSWAC